MEMKEGGDMPGEARCTRNALYLQAGSFSISFAFIVFVLFLQTPAVTPFNLFLAGFIFVISACLSFWILVYWLFLRLDEIRNKQTVILTALLLPALFLPLYFISY